MLGPVLMDFDLWMLDVDVDVDVDVYVYAGCHFG